MARIDIRPEHWDAAHAASHAVLQVATSVGRGRVEAGVVFATIAVLLRSICAVYGDKPVAVLEQFRFLLASMAAQERVDEMAPAATLPSPAVGCVFCGARGEHECRGGECLQPNAQGEYEPTVVLPGPLDGEAYSAARGYKLLLRRAGS